jgi:general secretion pathway protein A
MNEPEIRKTRNEESVMPPRPGPDSERPLGLVARRGVDQLFLDYFGMNEQPFGVTPDLRFLYLGVKHREALDALNYGTELNRGFLTLIAKPGMGKTSLLFHYLEGLRDKARTVFLCQTDGNSTGLMRSLLAELGLDGKGMDLVEMRALLCQVLMGEMQANRRLILVIDEAQNLSEKALESVRLLSNFETPWMKLMHIVLSGQPQLSERLAKPSMAQLRQRVSFAVRLEPFTREEVELYINHRMWVAGYKGSSMFSIGARALIAERSEGIPRVINNMCFCAMSYTWAMKRKTVDRDTMSEVLADLDPDYPVEPVEKKIEKETLAQTLPEEPRSVLLQPTQPVGLTLKTPAERSGILKFVLGCLVFLGLCWFGFQPDVQKRLASTYSSISAAVTNFLVPGSATSSPSPDSSAGADPLPASQRPKGLPGDMEMKTPQQDGVISTSSTGGQN